MPACVFAVKVDVRCTNVNRRQSPKYVLMYSPDGTDFMVQEGGVLGDRVGVGVESSKIMFIGAVPIHFFRRFCCRMYRLSTYRQTDGQKDRRQYNHSSRSYCMQQYDRSVHYNIVQHKV